MTSVVAASDFTTGALLTWAIPILNVFCVLVWWMAVMAIRAFRTPTDSG